MDDTIGTSSAVLFDACATENFEAVQNILQDPAYITRVLEHENHVIDEYERSFLNLTFMFNEAAKVGSTKIIRHLLSFAKDQGVSYEELIKRERICPAVSSGNVIAIFHELIAVKPECVNMCLRHLGTPLSQALGGDRNKPLYTGDRTPLIRFLLQSGADPNWVFGAYYVGPGHHLHEAIRCASLEVVELLLKHGAVIRQSGALHLAAEKCRIDVMILLLEHGAEVNEQLWENEPANASLFRTKLKKSFEITSEVLTDRHNRWCHETPLHMSELYLEVEASTWLVAHGSNMSIKDSQGWSAEDMAIKMGDFDILEALGISATMDE
jgi:hypothetical protein